MRKLILILTMLFSFNVNANSQNEIDYLLRFISETSCNYERNGTLYSGSVAVKHIIKKYQYFSEDITSAEDFILYAATKSSLSGKYYKVHCENSSSLKSRDWLLRALTIYRKAS